MQDMEEHEVKSSINLFNQSRQQGAMLRPPPPFQPLSCASAPSTTSTGGAKVKGGGGNAAVKSPAVSNKGVTGQAKSSGKGNKVNPVQAFAQGMNLAHPFNGGGGAGGLALPPIMASGRPVVATGAGAGGGGTREALKQKIETKLGEGAGMGGGMAGKDRKVSVQQLMAAGMIAAGDVVLCRKKEVSLRNLLILSCGPTSSCLCPWLVYLYRRVPAFNDIYWLQPI